MNMTRLSVPAKINKARFIVTCLTGNTNFPNPIPTLAVITLAINDLEATWNAAADVGKVKTATMHDKKDAVLAKMSALAIFVEATSANDVSKVNSSGFDVKQAGGNFVAEGLTVSLGKQSGEVNARVKSQPRSVFRWPYSTDPVTGTSWLDASVTTHSKVV